MSVKCDDRFFLKKFKSNILMKLLINILRNGFSAEVRLYLIIQYLRGKSKQTDLKDQTVLKIDLDK